MVKSLCIASAFCNLKRRRDRLVSFKGGKVTILTDIVVVAMGDADRWSPASTVVMPKAERTDLIHWLPARPVEFAVD